MIFASKMLEKDVSNIVIVDLTPQLAINLEKYSIELDSNSLKHGFSYNLLKSIHYLPYSNRLVAFDKKNRIPIGFLEIKEDKDVFIIENIVVDENYRKMGIASKLLKYAMHLAIKKGAKKVSLNVYQKNTNAINLYKKHNFEYLGNSIMGQGDLLGFSSSRRLIRRAFIGHGFLSKASLKNNNLIELKMESKKTRETLFKICSDSMSKKWINFFEINPQNIKKGSRRVWQPSIYVNAFINGISNSCALVFSYPFSHGASIEVYSNSETETPLMLENIQRFLVNRGISFVRITSFNANQKVEEWYKGKNMMTFHFLTMGKELK